MTDTHSHLYLSDFDADRAQCMERAIAAGVTRLVLPNVDLDSIPRMRAMHALWPDNTRMAMGLHPTELGPDDSALQTVMAELDQHLEDYVAVGEIGVDLYWDASQAERQMRVFDAQVARAVELDLPVLIHSRNALDQTLEVLETYRGRVRGVMHCFGGTDADVDAVRRRAGDFYFGIGGVLTFKNSGLGATVPAIGLERILLETDCPWLAPVPWRGKRNESAMLPAVADRLAAILGIEKAEVDRVTSANSIDLLGF